MTLRDRLRLVLPPIAVLWTRPVPDIADRAQYRPLIRYQPLFSPWIGDASFTRIYEDVQGLTMLDAERAWIVWSLARQCAHLTGDFVEAGVYRGGSALLIRDALQRSSGRQRLHLFDSFAGLPAPGPRDRHARGDLADTNVAVVGSLFAASPEVAIHPGWIPDTFVDSGLVSVAFAHVDLDLEGSIVDACTYLYPRLQPGGVLVFDDYGFPSCPGARVAIDRFFSPLPEVPLILATGQAVVTRLPSPPGDQATLNGRVSGSSTREPR
jgi:O-methyltransferase